MVTQPQLNRERKPAPTEAPKMECVRWSWTGDVYNRKVYCLEWRKKK